MRSKIYGVRCHLCLMPTTCSGALNRLWEPFRPVSAAWTSEAVYGAEFGLHSLTQNATTCCVSIYILANCECFFAGAFFLWLGIGKGVDLGISRRDMFKIEDCLFITAERHQKYTHEFNWFFYMYKQRCDRTDAIVKIMPCFSFKYHHIIS